MFFLLQLIIQPLLINRGTTNGNDQSETQESTQRDAIFEKRVDQQEEEVESNQLSEIEKRMSVDNFRFLSSVGKKKRKNDHDYSNFGKGNGNGNFGFGRDMDLGSTSFSSGQGQGQVRPNLKRSPKPVYPYKFFASVGKRSQ